MIVERNNAKPARWLTWLGLVLVPVLVAGGLFAATWNGNPRQVDAAIVNLDEPVTIDDQYIPLGRQLTAALVDSDRVENLTWLPATETDARAGLASGRYAAMVVIPADFSAAATSYGGDAAEARRATIQVETSPVAGIADATLGKVVAHTAATTLNETLTSTYLDQIYLGFNEMGDNFVTMADGAGELADGAEVLADGIAEAADGSVQLADGTGELADGLATMANQTSSLPKDTRKLANGTSDLADGVEQYVDGVNQLVDQTLDSLGKQGELVAGVGKLATGADDLAGGLRQYQAAMGELSKNKDLMQGAQQAADQQASSDGVQQTLKGAADQAASKAAKPAQDAAAQAVPCPDDIQAMPGGCAIFEAGRSAGVQVGVGVGAQAGAQAGLQVGLGVGVPVGVGAAGQAASQGLGAPDQATSLVGGSQALAGGLSVLQEQLASAGGSDPSAELGQLKSAGKQLVKGTAELAKGTDQLADGIPRLVDGIGQSADGASQLADGMTEFSDGLGEAADGSRELADGARQLADGIAEGKDKLPSYPDSDRQNLADVVAAPINTDNLQGTAGAGIGWATLLMVLALWAGALATFVVVRAVGSRLLGSARSSAYLVTEALLPGVIVVSIQAVVVTVIGQFALQLPFGKLVGLLGLMLVAGVAFVAVNHALVAWFGGTGRLVSLGLAVLSLATMLTSAEPTVFGVLRVFSPLTPALDAIRALLTESTGVATNLFLMIAWLIAGLAASSIAVVRNRTTSIPALLAEHGVTT